jgi:hypothetical protein
VGTSTDIDGLAQDCGGSSGTHHHDPGVFIVERCSGNFLITCVDDDDCAPDWGTCKPLNTYIDSPASDELSHLEDDDVLPGTGSPKGLVLFDLRPLAGSVLLGGFVDTPADGFFGPAPFRGAFSRSRNWMVGWTALYGLGYFARCDLATSSASVPDEVRKLGLTDRDRLRWDLTRFNNRTYDLMRSTSRSDFTAPFFVETAGYDTGARDPGTPGTGGVYYYLVRGGNLCGPGSLGTDSEGVERTGP